MFPTLVEGDCQDNFIPHRNEAYLVPVKLSQKLGQMQRTLLNAVRNTPASWFHLLLVFSTIHPGENKVPTIRCNFIIQEKKIFRRYS